MIPKLVIRRIGVGLLMLWLVSVLVFASIHVLPGDAAKLLLGHDVTPEALEGLTKELGLDRSVWTQYWDWMGGLLTGNWGDSLVSPISVGELVRMRMANTFLLAMFTMAIVAPLSVTVGIYSATRNGRPIDGGISVLTLCLSSLPGFVIGIVFIYTFSTNVLRIVPAASILDPQRSVFGQLDLLIAPTITAALMMLPYPTRMVRAAMIDVLQSDYVEMARLKGLPERTVVFRHALRNCLAPIVQALGLTLLFLLGGIIVVEAVFSFPGIGLTLVQATNQRDGPVLQTVTVLLAATCVLVNLVSDLGVLALTPRMRARL
jgi:peptide/nickel transport system permease protein